MVPDQCTGLESVKNVKTRMLIACSSIVPADPMVRTTQKYYYVLTWLCLLDRSGSNALGTMPQAVSSLQKVESEEEQYREALALVQDQLDVCKKDLKMAEKERATAMVYRAEFESLRRNLSLKDEEVLTLSSELSQQQQELLQLKDKIKEGPPRSISEPSQQSYLLDAREGAEEVYISKLEELHMKIQTLEQALTESNCLRLDVEEQLEYTLSHCQSYHSDSTWATDPEPLHKAVGEQSGVTVRKYREVGSQSLDAITGGAIVKPTLPDHILPSVAGQSAVPQRADPLLDIVPGGDVGIGTGFISHHMVGPQWDSVLNPDVACLELNSHQADKQLDSTTIPSATHIKPIQHCIAPQLLDGSRPNAIGFVPSSHFLDISKPYMLSHQQLIFFLSTAVGLIAIVIAYRSEPEIPHSSMGSIRPGWAWHRSEGLAVPI
ncbi:hypothetical protein BC826DRAFT_1022943 [Russula brevipes]|nr:hypothetical protein BC826DRAFT_1022943 [Russula brevipes]